MKQRPQYSYEPRPEHYMLLIASLRYVLIAAGLFAWLSVLTGFPYLAGMSGELTRPLKQIGTVIGIAAIPTAMASWGMHWYVARHKNMSKPSRAWMAWQIIASLGVLGVALVFIASIS